MSEPATTIVIFGASGDLTQRMLIPSLNSLFSKGKLPESINIVGYAITDYSNEQFRDHLREAMKKFAPEKFSPDSWADFAKRLWYVQGDFAKPADFATLQKQIKKLEGGPANRVYYLATAPRFFATIAEQLGQQGMAQADEGERRIVVEKPFGTDLESAKQLNTELHKVFEEGQIFRIDHFLGKETAQNILFFRFANTLFELGWNRNYIANVQITAAETIDVGHRGGYYDKAGVLRDMFQNHILQLLALTAMEPPASFDADAIRNEKVKVLSALRPVPPEHMAERTVRGQYEGYRHAPDVDPASETATYAAVLAYIDNWRWQGVPFFLRSGKALDVELTEIAIEFRRPPHVMFPFAPGDSIAPNILSLCIHPDEGIHFTFEAKVPDTTANMQTVDMDFQYDKSAIPEAYERLLLDALAGDASLFTRSDGIEAAWRFIDPIIAGWQSKNAPPLAIYKRGSAGPDAAEALVRDHGTKWQRGCGV
jgi:glucose-6-phosphate 1-dehydrogenase